MESSPIQTTSEERLLAALAHFLGLWVALVVYLVERGKSRFVSFQALQAIAFDVVVWIGMFVIFSLIASLLGLLAAGIAVFSAILAGQAASGSQPDGLIGFIALAFFFMPFTIGFLAMLVSIPVLVLRIIATLKVAQGRDYRYPWLGAYVSRISHI
jgi:uncharacterized Tic20 family protein